MGPPDVSHLSPEEVAVPKKKPEAIEELKSQAQKIWLAGLGAFAEAEKKSDKLFRSLVKKGKKYETTVRDPLERASESMKGSLASATSQASKSFKEVETMIERGVASAMKRAGIASQDEVAKLRKEVANLTKALEKSRKKAAKGAKKKAAAKAGKAASTARETSGTTKRTKKKA